MAEPAGPFGCCFFPESPAAAADASAAAASISTSLEISLLSDKPRYRNKNDYKKQKIFFSSFYLP
jgi:hypothetical protein